MTTRRPTLELPVIPDAVLLREYLAMDPRRPIRAAYDDDTRKTQELPALEDEVG